MAVGSFKILLSSFFHWPPNSFSIYTYRQLPPPLSTLQPYLEHGNIAAIGNEMWLNNLGNLSPILRPSLSVSRIIVSKLAVLSGRDPQRKASGVSLGIDVGTRTDQEIEAELFGKGHDRHEIVGAIFEVEDAWGRFVVAPAVVDAEGCEAGGFDLF